MATLGTVSYGLQLNGVRKFVGGTQSATKGIGALNKGLIALTAATGAVALGMKHLADSAGQFQEGLAAVGAVTKATAADMDMLKRAAIQAGIATQFSPKEAVDGLLSLSTAGQTATQAAKTLIPVLNLAAGSLGQLSTAEAGMAIVGTMNTYGMAADKAGEVTDKLLRITQLTNFQTRDFAAGLAKAAAKSNVFGQSLDDTLVVMGLMRNANIDASSASTAYTMAVQRVATDTQALNTLQKLGVSLYDKQTGATRGFMDLIIDLKPKLEGLTDATASSSCRTSSARIEAFFLRVKLRPPTRPHHRLETKARRSNGRHSKQGIEGHVRGACDDRIQRSRKSPSDGDTRRDTGHPQGGGCHSAPTQQRSVCHRGE